MNCRTRSICLAIFVGLVIDVEASTPAEPRDTPTSASIDCSKAGSMMMQPPSMPAITPSGDIDKDFAMAMMMRNNAMMSMMKIEITCGRNAKAKALANEMLEQETLNDGFLRQLISGGG